MSRPGESGHADRVLAGPGPIDGDEGESCNDCPLVDPNPAVYRVPDPRYDIATVTPLCEYHLAALKREFPMEWRDIRSHPEIEGLERATAENVLIEQDDVPDEISVDETLYRRLGLDEKGRAYFVTEIGSGDYRVLETDERFDILESAIVASGQLFEFFDRIRGQVGWRGLEDEWVDRAQAEFYGGDGDE